MRVTYTLNASYEEVCKTRRPNVSHATFLNLPEMKDKGSF